MSTGRELLHTGVEILLYCFLYAATAAFVSMALRIALPEEAYLAVIVITGLSASLVANWLSMRIYEQRGLVDVGLPWNGLSARNLGYGIAGGMGAATLVLSLPLAAGAARIHAIPGGGTSFGTVVFLTIALLAGAAGEEILFRGYGFQVLVKAVGPAAAILPVGVLFGLMHAGNPNASRLGLANTVGFGILFGYAFLRSRDIWLPIGLHFGWNLTLPLFGVNVSGLRIGMTGYVMEWTAGSLWSGGDYGPEASILTSAVFCILFIYLWKAPIRRQASPLLDPPETQPCAPGPQS